MPTPTPSANPTRGPSANPAPDITATRGPSATPTPDNGLRVAVTGAAGYLGRLLVRRLLQSDTIEYVLATDIRPIPSATAAPNPKPTPSDLGAFYRIPPSACAKLEFAQRDVRAPMSDIFAQNGINAAAHLAFAMRPDRRGASDAVNIGGAENILNACAAAGIQRILYMSSAAVYGAHPDNPALLDESAPLRPPRGFRYAESKVRVEAALQTYAARHTAARVCVLRASPVLGAGADNFIAKSLSKRTLIAVKGYDPPMQFLREDDAADIMARCIINGVHGAYNIGGNGYVRWSDMARVAGSRLLRIPAAPLYAAADISWRLGLQRSSPASGLDFIRYPWRVSSAKLAQEHGIAPSGSSREAWQAFAARKLAQPQNLTDNAEDDIDARIDGAIMKAGEPK